MNVALAAWHPSYDLVACMCISAHEASTVVTAVCTSLALFESGYDEVGHVLKAPENEDGRSCVAVLYEPVEP